MKKLISTLVVTIIFVSTACSENTKQAEPKKDVISQKTLKPAIKKTEELDVKAVEIANLIKSGKTLIKNENWEKADIIYKEILKKSPHNKSALRDMDLITRELKNKHTYMLAVKLFTNKEFKKSIDTFEKLPKKTIYRFKYEVERKDRYFKKLINLTDLELEKKDYNKAKDLLTIADRIYKDKEEVKVRTIFILKETRNTKLAKSLIKTAKEILEEGKYQEALKKIDEAISADLFYLKSYMTAVEISKEMKRYKLAIKYLEDFLKLSPDTPSKNKIKTIIEELKKQN